MLISSLFAFEYTMNYILSLNNSFIPSSYFSPSISPLFFYSLAFCILIFPVLFQYFRPSAKIIRQIISAETLLFLQFIVLNTTSSLFFITPFSTLMRHLRVHFMNTSWIVLISILFFLKLHNCESSTLVTITS